MYIFSMPVMVASEIFVDIKMDSDEMMLKGSEKAIVNVSIENVINEKFKIWRKKARIKNEYLRGWIF